MLSEPARLRLLALAAHEELSIGELAELLQEESSPARLPARHGAPARRPLARPARGNAHARPSRGRRGARPRGRRRAHQRARPLRARRKPGPHRGRAAHEGSRGPRVLRMTSQGEDRRGAGRDRRLPRRARAAAAAARAGARRRDRGWSAARGAGADLRARRCDRPVRRTTRARPRSSGGARVLET